MVHFQRAVPQDADTLILVQNQSFYADYVKYGTCPGYGRTKDSMEESISRHFVYKILWDDLVVGDIIVKDNGEGHYHLGGICVVPQWEGRGIGQAAMKFLSSAFPDARHWTLETPSDKERNHRFYLKSGFHITKEYHVDGVRISLFEKDVI